MLFAAGRGKRLRPLTDAIAKPALPILDVPLAAWGLAALCAEAAPVVVNVSHLAGGVIAALEPLGLRGWEPSIEEPEAFGTAGTLSSLRHRVGDRLLTWNGDVVASLPPAALLDAHRGSGRPATIAIRSVEEGADVVMRDGRVDRFVDRRRENLAGGQFLGVAVFERGALGRLSDERPAGLGETLLRALAEHEELGVHLTDGYWIDVGTAERFLRASLDVLYERAPGPPMGIPGEVLAVEGGRAYVGPGAHVEEDALGPGAIVLAGATVEPGAWIENAVVWPHEQVPPARFENTVVHRPRP